jgi:Domain of unknown function (DUF4832)/Domain of unknown function (DUF4874)/Secretion system C-terminal sorting domain
MEEWIIKMIFYVKRKWSSTQGWACCLYLSLFIYSIQSTAQTQVITYAEDTSHFANPERGLFHQWLSDSKAPSPLSMRQFNQLRQDKMTLVRRLYSMTTFRTTEISNSFLQHIQQDMQALRQNGVKAIVRFAYTFNEAAPHDDAPLALVLKHIEQLAPVLQDNADVIAYLEAGFIGRWGEWHTSSNKLDNTADRRVILQKLLDVLPSSRAVAIRTQQMKKDIFQENKPLSLTDALSGINRARTAHHNDCFCAAIDDWGTYSPTDASSLKLQKDYLNQENRFLPQGGETCNLNPPRSDCSDALEDLIQMRWSTLNDDYHPDVLDSWRSQACYPEIRKRLGYRFRLISANFPLVARAGSTYGFSFNIQNVGFATPYNVRDVELVLRGTSGQVFRFKLNDLNPRLWFPELGVINVQASLLFPHNLPPDDYQFLLNLPDPAPTLNGVGAYAIRLANEQVWEPSTGYNDLHFTLRLNPATSLPHPNLLDAVTLYPNPANQQTTLKYTLAAKTMVRVQVLDLLGRVVLEPFHEEQPTGTHQLPIPTNSLPGSLWVVRIFLGEDGQTVKSLVVNHEW